MDQVESETCVKFVKRTNEPDYLLFIDDGPNRCFSYVGLVGGMQEVSIGDGCDAQLGVIEHELLHALGKSVISSPYWFPGIAHEQSRPDRDDYVTVLLDNVQRDRQVNFDKYGTGDVYSMKVPYDYNSIMHYHSTAFTWNGRPTLETADKTFVCLSLKKTVSGRKT